MPDSPPLVVPDYRRPGQAMASVPIKLPADLLAQLQNRADLLCCSRAALGRVLIAQGLERLETAAAAWGEPGPVSDADEMEGARVIVTEAG